MKPLGITAGISSILVLAENEDWCLYSQEIVFLFSLLV